MNFNNDNNIPIIQLLWIAGISFFGAFAKELNDYAKMPKEKHNFLLFISEILLSGVCGTLLGIVTKVISSNPYIIMFCSGIGGILGLQLVKFVIRVVLVMKNIDLDKVKFDELDESDSSNNKKKK